MISSFDSAREMGAIALFGEKYGEQVRIVKIDAYSLELCGGTHVNSTSNIGIFKIRSEQGIGSSLRRIEAITGERALDYIKKNEYIVNDISEKLQINPPELLLKIDQIVTDLNNLKKEMKIAQNKLAQYEINKLLSKKKEIKGIAVIAARVNALNSDELRDWGDLIKEKINSGIILLGAELNQNKVGLLAMVTEDLVLKGFDAKNIITAIAPIVNGKGGGKKAMAQAGGTRADKLNEALNKLYELF